MNLLKYLILLSIFLNFINFQVSANESVAFANIDLIVKNTNIGKSTLDKINNINSSNLKKLEDFEKNLKSQEDQIKNKKNLLSDEEYQNEISKLKKKINEYNKKKNEMVNNFKNSKNNELQNLFKTINPIIQNYMKENSVDILLNNKNIFIGSKKLDLTQKLITVIDEKIKID